MVLPAHDASTSGRDTITDSVSNSSAGRSRILPSESWASYAEPEAFFDDLDGFLRRLPRSVRYCVEIRNDDYLQSRYFEVLRSNRVAHTLTSWSRMPSLQEQLLIEDVFTASHTVARALLRPGRTYEQAVTLFLRTAR